MILSKSIVACCFLAFLAVSCSDETDKDLTNSVNKNGAVETSVTTKHLTDTSDVLITSHLVWKNNNAVKTAEYHDTIPALGTERKEVKDTNGNSVNTDVKKDYEIYITVK